MTPLGMYVRRRRMQRGWTVAELSRQSNIPYGTLRNIEQNTKPVKPKESTIRALAEALEEEDADILFALAGYGIPISPTAESRQHSIDVLLAGHPEWWNVLQKIQTMPPERQDQALQVLLVFVGMNNNGTT
jgi:transcriptional regulator with XRE-family HTH domain